MGVVPRAVGLAGGGGVALARSVGRGVGLSGLLERSVACVVLFPLWVGWWTILIDEFHV